MIGGIVFLLISLVLVIVSFFAKKLKIKTGLHVFMILFGLTGIVLAILFFTNTI